MTSFGLYSSYGMYSLVSRAYHDSAEIESSRFGE